MNLKGLLTIGLFLCFGNVRAQQQTEYHFFVQFIDKGLNYVDINKPELFLSQRCLERRERLGVQVDSADLPVTAAYIDNIRKPSITVRYVSKWLNGAVISTAVKDSAYRLKIKFFVDRVVYLGKSDKKTIKSGSQSVDPLEADDSKKLYGDGFQQLDMLNGTMLHKHGYTGNDMLIAVLDAGFKKVNTLSLFEKLYKQKRVIYAYDLVDLEENTYEDDDHGLHVMGCLAANKEGTMIGSAPDAEYILLRTESNKFESWLEELNWVRAAEIADSMGVDVINSSLGYNTFDEEVLNHKHKELDGKTTYISRGAAMAAKKGILVVNSAGNDGNKPWEKIDFPADVEEVLAVGAVDTRLDPSAFSSIGPTADYRIKPDVVALGKNTTIGTTYGVGTGNGTSYSCPIIAGMSACLWQANPDLSAQQIRHVVIHSSHLYPEADNVQGYGLPDFDLALAMIGKHPEFDYKRPGLYKQPQRSLNHKESFTAYAPGETSVFCRVKLRKKFLFIPFKRSKGLYEGVVNEHGFARISVLLYNIPSGKTVDLIFYTLDEKGHHVLLEEYSNSLK